MTLPNTPYAAASALVTHARKRGRMGHRGSLTRLAFRLLEEDERFFPPIATRMGIEAKSVEDLVGKIWEQNRLAEALDLAGEPS